MSEYTDIRMTWPRYEEMAIKDITGLAEAFGAFLTECFGIEILEYAVTADGIVITVETTKLKKILDES